MFCYLKRRVFAIVSNQSDSNCPQKTLLHFKKCLETVEYSKLKKSEISKELNTQAG